MYTGQYYDNFIEGYIRRFKGYDITGRNHNIPNGRKAILWWDRQCVDQDGREFRILRTSHPERQRKEPFVEQIARWITSEE
jgi:hypothetical protein